MPLYYQKHAIIRKKEFYQPYDNSYQPAEAKYEPKYCPHFCPENVFCFLSIDVHYKLDFFMEANNMNLIRLLPCEQSDLGPYCLQYRLP